MLRTQKEKIVVYHGTKQGEFYDLESESKGIFQPLECTGHGKKEKNEMLARCFDASVFYHGSPSSPAWTLLISPIFELA